MTADRDTRAESKQIGFALVGLGKLATEELIPAFAACKYARLTALVSGERDKAEQVRKRHGLEHARAYDYASFDQLADQPEVDAVYLVLPNHLHAEYTVRAAQAGKHVLCEKPMANTVAECQQMIDATDGAGKLLMIAYRLQYEPFTRDVIRRVRTGEIGRLRSIVATNTQVMPDPNAWRLKRAQAGGGPLTDIGIYCINSARYLSGEEPIEVSAMMERTAGDPRWAEVEEQIHFILRFPSGLLAASASSYGLHDSRDYQLLGERGSISMLDGYSYRGTRMQIHKRRADGSDELITPSLREQNHFSLQIDHFARCIVEGRRPHTPGEEGLQDVRIIRAIYEAAERGRSVALPAVAGVDPFRGPPPD